MKCHPRLTEWKSSPFNVHSSLQQTVIAKKPQELFTLRIMYNPKQEYISFVIFFRKSTRAILSTSSARMLARVQATVRKGRAHRLSHYSKELFLIDFPVSVTVGLINHFLELFISQVLSQFFANSFEILE